jgi:hypothetical protein
VGSDWVRGECDAALTSGVGSTVLPDLVLNRFKPNQIYFKWIQICPKLRLTQKVPSWSQKIPKKIWMERS